MVTIRDMLVVNQLEKTLGRRLTEQEMSGETFEVKIGNVWANFSVPLLVFPDDMLPPYALNLLPEERDDGPFYEEFEAF